MSNHLHKPFHCCSQCFCIHFLRCLISRQLSVAAGSDLGDGDKLFHKTHTNTCFLHCQMEIYPSIFSHRWKRLFTQTLPRVSKLYYHKKNIPHRFFFLSLAVSVQHPSNLSFRNSYKAIEPWVSVFKSARWSVM